MKNFDDIILLFHSLNKNACLNIFKKLNEGNIKRVDDEILQYPVIEINGEDFQRNFITIDYGSNNEKQNFQINFLNIHIKKIHKSFQITINYLEEQDQEMEIVMSTHAINCKVIGNKATIPLRLEKDWNFLQIDLQDLSFKIFQTYFKKFLSLNMHSNCRISAIYLSQQKYKQKNVDFAKIIQKNFLQD